MDSIAGGSMSIHRGVADHLRPIYHFIIEITEILLKLKTNSPTLTFFVDDAWNGVESLVQVPPARDGAGDALVVHPRELMIGLSAAGIPEGITVKDSHSRWARGSLTAPGASALNRNVDRDLLLRRVAMFGSRIIMVQGSVET